MIEHKFVGFILNATEYGENDVIYNVLTNNSIKTFKARGIKKVNSKNSGSCNYFMLSEFTTTSKTENSNQTLKQASLIKHYKKPYEDVLVSYTYLFICSLLNSLGKDVNGYEIALKCFDAFENNIYPISILNYFLKKVLITLGYYPSLKGCALCNNKQNLMSFDFASGGFICKNCFDSSRFNRLPSAYLKEMYALLNEDEIYEISKEYAIKFYKMTVEFLKEVLYIKDNYLTLIDSLL